MTLVLAVELTADATGLTGELRLSKEELAKLGGEARQAGQRAVQASRGLDRMGARSDAAARSLGRLRSLLLATVSAETLRRLVLLADGYEAVQAQIRLATRELGDYVTANRELDRIADETGVLLGDTVAVFRAIARTAPELRATQDQVLAVTEAVQQLGAISNTLPENLRAGLRQFGQAMSSQIVRAEEFNSILENIPELAVRIARGMGTTVGQLRLAVVEGRVLSADVFRALESQTDEIAEDFESLPPRISRSANRIRNALSESLAGLNEQSGLTAGLAGAMDLLAANMDTVVRGALALAAGYAAARAAALAYAAAQGVANLALSRSPFGIVLTGIGLVVGAYTALKLRTDDATGSNDRFEEAMRQSNSVLETAAQNARRVAEERRQQAIQTTEAALAEQELRAATARQLVDENRARIDRMRERSGGRDVSEGVSRVEQTIAGLETAAEEADAKVLDLREQIARLNETIPTAPAAGVAGLRDVASETETEVAKLIAQMERARATGALELGIAGLSERDQALTRARFEALAAAQADFNEGLRDSALLLPEEIAAIEAAAGAAFDYAEALEEIEEGQRQARNAADALGNAAGAALTDIRRGAFDATEAVNRLIDALFQALVIDPFTQAVSDFAFGFFNPTADTGPASLPGPGGGQLAHGGGILGRSMLPIRAVDPAVFAGAPRMHLGGLLPGERPIIARDGEGVFTPEQMAAMAPAGRELTLRIVDGQGQDIPARRRQGAGGPELEVTLDALISRLVRSPGTRTRQALEALGARPLLTTGL